jgi:hypothetical protein
MDWKVVNEEYSVVNKGNFSQEFRPSEYIEDAWEVVEKLRKEKDYWFELTTDESFSLKYRCYFQLDDMESTAITETAPMSICLAALKSAGVEIGD